MSAIDAVDGSAIDVGAVKALAKSVMVAIGTLRTKQPRPRMSAIGLTTDKGQYCR